MIRLISPARGDGLVARFGNASVAPDSFADDTYDAHSVTSRKQKALILGVNGFIGSALARRLLSAGYSVSGIDLNDTNIAPLMDLPSFRFLKGDIREHRADVHREIEACDIVLPLIAICTPAEYVRNPVEVFELNFSENLWVIQECVKNQKRLIFPSTSEVYGMCQDESFDEHASRLVMGPIDRQRWIYASGKAMLERIIYAHGESDGLDYTVFRPFNWIGPRLDSVEAARSRRARVITQMVQRLVDGLPIQLVDGGEQKRCFTYIDDGVDCLARIVGDTDGASRREIFNIGNPDGEASIADIAKRVVDAFERHPGRRAFPPFQGFQVTTSSAFYGPGYQDVARRRPSIENAKKRLGWTPSVGLDAAVAATVDWLVASELKSENLLPAFSARPRPDALLAAS